MKKSTWKILALIFVIIVLLTIVTNGVFANEKVPYDELTLHVLGFEIPTGHYCVTDYRDGMPFTECYCDCDNDTIYTKYIEPQDIPTPEITETPESTQKPNCNAGRGNGSEGDPDCDPGNSGDHNQGGD